MRACEEIRGGALLEQFVVDVIQGGAGTSTNMNANEVIANRGARAAGRAEGRLRAPAPARPRQPVAEHQRRLPDGGEAGAAVRHPAAAAAKWTCLEKGIRAKAAEFADVLKIGRTQLQDAVPMTLGQEFSTYAVMLQEDESRLAEAASLDPRDQPGRHRHRHRHQRAPGVRGARDAHAVRDRRRRVGRVAQPHRGDAGRGRLRAALGRAQARRGEALQGLQRPAAAVLGPARRPRRNQPAGGAGGLLDHAGQGQPGDSRGGEPGGLRGHRQRHHRHHGRGRRAAAAERLRADHRAQPVQEHLAPGGRLPHARRALRAGHHRQPRARAAPAGRFHRAGHRAQSRTSATRARARSPRRRSPPAGASTTWCWRKSS